MAQSWWDVDLTSLTTNASQVGFAGALTGIPVGSDAFVFYIDTNQNVHQLSISGTSLSDSNLTGNAHPCPPATAVPVTAAKTGLSSFFNNFASNVVYQPPTIRVTGRFPAILNPIHLFSGSMAWVDQTLTGIGTGFLPAGNNGLSGVVDTNGGQHVFYVDENGQVTQLTAAPYSSGCAPWVSLNVTSNTPPQGTQTWTAVSGGAIASFSDANGAYHVAAVGSDGYVFLLSYDPTTSTWSGTPFENVAQQVSPGSGLSGLVDSNGVFVFYIAQDNSVHVLHDANPDFNLTANTTSDPSNNPPPNAAQMSSLSSFSDEFGEHVVYIGADQHVHQFVNTLGSPDTTWNDQDLTTIAQPFIPSESAKPQAAQISALSCFANTFMSISNVEWIFYIGNDNHVHLLTFAPQPQWPPPNGGGNGPLQTPLCPAGITGEVGTPYNVTLMASGGTPPYQFNIPPGMLPPGLTVVGNQITGTPSQANSFTYTLTVTDANHNTSKPVSCSIFIEGPLAPLMCPVPTATVNQQYTSTVSVTGGMSPYTFALTGGDLLMSGLTFSSSSSSYTIQGTPTAEGVYTFSIQVTDADGATQTNQCQITVTGSFEVTVQQFVWSVTEQVTGGWPGHTTSTYTWVLDGPANGLSFVDFTTNAPVVSGQTGPGRYLISGVMNGAQLTLGTSYYDNLFTLCTATQTPSPFFTVTAGSVTQIFVQEGGGVN
jgi:hypothetical protein